MLEVFKDQTVQGIHCSGYEPGVCGRVAARVGAYIKINGYDQEEGVMPSGFEDIDLKNRLKQLDGGAVAGEEP